MFERSLRTTRMRTLELDNQVEWGNSCREHWPSMLDRTAVISGHWDVGVHGRYTRHRTTSRGWLLHTTSPTTDLNFTEQYTNNTNDTSNYDHGFTI